MGVNKSKLLDNVDRLGDFNRLPQDLRKFEFINKYLHRCDIVLLYIACYANVSIVGVDVLYYIRYYSTNNTTTNLDLYKYYDFEDCIFNGDSDLSHLKFLHINGIKLTNRNFPRGLINVDVVQYICDNKIALPEECLAETAVSSSMDILSCLHTAGYKFGRRAFLKYLDYRRNNIELLGRSELYESDPSLDFLFENTKLESYDDIFIMALIYCDYFVLKKMIGKFVEPSDSYYTIFYNNLSESGFRHMKYLKTHYSIGKRHFESLLK